MINLLPYNLRNERKYGRLNQALIGNILVLAATAACLAVILIANAKKLSTAENELQSKIQVNEQRIKELKNNSANTDAIAKKLSEVNQLYEQNVRFSELIPDIGNLLPSGTRLNGLSLDGLGNSTPLSLDVDLASPELAAVLTTNLIESDLFVAADITTISARDAGQYSYSAQITARFTPPPETPTELEEISEEQTQ